MLRHELRPTLFLLGLVLVCLFVVQALCLDFRAVSGPSMSPTLPEGRLVGIFRLEYGLRLPFMDNYLLVWKGPQAGDIVVFREPGSDHLLVKRCLGGPGDALRVEDDQLSINGYKVALSPAQAQRLQASPQVPAGSFFLVGDNQAHSRDSRDLGFIRVEDITGKMVF